MALQTDLQSPVDLTVQESTSADILQQTMDQLAPRANIGFVIYDTVEPDVVNNARFVRYFWLDTNTVPPVPKVYNTDTEEWEPYTLADDSVSEPAQIADGAITLAKLGGFVLANALKLLRVNAAGDGVELVTLNNDLLPTIELNKLNTAGGAANYVLKFNNAGSAVGWEAFDPSVIVAQNTIALNKLVNGLAAQYGHILRANPATGVIELVDNNDSATQIFEMRSMRWAVMSDLDANSKKSIKYNGATYGPEPTVFVSADTAFVASSQFLNVAHGLNGVPDNIQVYLINKGNASGIAHGYAVGDVVDMRSVRASGDADPLFGIYATATNILLGCPHAGGITAKIVNKAQTAIVDMGGTGITNLLTDFNVRVICSRIQY